MGGGGSRWIVVVVTAGALVAGGSAPTAAREGAGWDGRSTISGPALPEWCHATRSEASPQIVRHPGEPELLTATFLTEGTLAAVAATSRDGGRTWAREALTPASRCSGGSEDHAILVNPQLAGGPLGAAYFGNSWLNGEEEPLFRYGVTVHGRDIPSSPWSDGTSPGRGDRSQNLALVPDPAIPGIVTAVWTHMDQVPTSNLGPVWYAYATSELLAAVSVDGGRTFDVPHLAAVEPGRMIVNVRAERTTDGAILAVYDSVPVTVYAGRVTGEAPVFRHHARRSSDGGRTWTAAADVGERQLSDLRDPEDPQATRVAGSYKFHLATGPDGAAAVVWAEPAADGRVAIRLTTSSDGGQTWASAATVLERRGAFQPAVAIDDAGDLAILFYDWTRDVPGDAGLTTDVWLATRHGDATTWDVHHLDGPMDLRQARREGLDYDGLAIGVYQDIVGLPDGFGAAYTVAPPQAVDGGTDVRFARWGGVDGIDRPVADPVERWRGRDEARRR